MKQRIVRSQKMTEILVLLVFIKYPEDDIFFSICPENKLQTSAN
jgi:hypothetical protein